MSLGYCKQCQSALQQCATCKGEGKTYESGGLFSGGGYVPCKTCGGSGKVCPAHGNRYS